MRYEFHPSVQLLLKKESVSKVQMDYAFTHSWPMPEIKKRPPYYTDPQYVLNYSTI